MLYMSIRECQVKEGEENEHAPGLGGVLAVFEGICLWLACHKGGSCVSFFLL